MTNFNQSGQIRPPAFPASKADGPVALVAAALIVRLGLQSSFLNQFLNYDTAGGNIAEKISAGTYALIAIAFILYLARRNRLDPRGRLISIALFVTAACGIAWLLATGRTTAAGFLIDSVLCGSASMYCLGYLSDRGREVIFKILVAFMLCHAALLLSEFLTHWRLLPYPQGRLEAQFRPTGLFTHPLNNGLLYAVLIPVVMGTKWPLYIRNVIAIACLLTVLISGARFASIFAAIAYFLSAAWANFDAVVSSNANKTVRSLSILQAAGISSVVPFIAIFVTNSSLMYRFQGNLFDNSARSRLEIYSLIERLDQSSFWLGAGNDTLTKWASGALGMRSVESPIVVSIFVLGALLSIVFFVGILTASYLSVRKSNFYATLSAMTFLIVAFSNNVLLTKSPVLTFSLAFIYCSMAARALPRSAAHRATPLPRAVAVSTATSLRLMHKRAS